MTTSQPAVLFVRVPAVPAEVEDRWNAWYDKIHIQYRMDKPHFLGASRYRALSGAQRYFIFYELASVDALTSPEYLEHRRWETAQPPGTFEAIAPNLPRFERGVYEQTFGPLWGDAALDTPALFIAGYDPAPEHEASFNTWCDSEHAESIGRVAGVTGLRRFQLTQTPLTAKSGVKTARPKYLSACYLESEAVADRETFRRELEGTWRRSGNLDTAPFAMLGRRIYSVAAKQSGTSTR